jgi:hypothetical protein
MKAGSLSHDIAYMLPEGVDADVHLYFVSDRVGLTSKVSVSGVHLFAVPTGFLTEAAKITKDPSFTQLADDWRLMTRVEIIAYRKQQQQEAERADQNPQEGGRPTA